MKCPYCGKEMEEGCLDSRSRVLWTRRATGLPFPTGADDVILGQALGMLRPKAWLCRECRRVTVEY